MRWNAAYGDEIYRRGDQKRDGKRKRETGRERRGGEGEKRGEEEIIYQYEKWRESRCGVSVEEEKRRRRLFQENNNEWHPIDFFFLTTSPIKLSIFNAWSSGGIAQSAELPKLPLVQSG